MRPLLLSLLLSLTVGTKAHSSPTLEYEVYVKPTDHFDTAHFRMWISDGHSKLTGILVLIPGTSHEGEGQATLSMSQRRA